MKEDSHNGTYRTNIGSEHYGCDEERHSTSEKEVNEKPRNLIETKKHLTSKVRSQNNRSDGSQRVLTGIGTYLKLRKFDNLCIQIRENSRAVGNH